MLVLISHPNSKRRTRTENTTPADFDLWKAVARKKNVEKKRPETKPKFKPGSKVKD